MHTWDKLRWKILTDMFYCGDILHQRFCFGKENICITENFYDQGSLLGAVGFSTDPKSPFL